MFVCVRTMGVYIKIIDVVVFQSSYISGPCDLYTAVLVLFQGSPVSGPHGLYLCTIVVLYYIMIAGFTRVWAPRSVRW